MKKQADLALMLTLFVVTAAVFGKSASFPFAAIDDHVYVTSNPWVAQGLSLDSLKWAFTSFYAANWHPLTWLSLMLDAQLFGLKPAGFHLVNVALHSANALLLYRLLSALTGAAGRSAFVAACFALHPQHVESVVWITERKDVLSTLFLLLTLLGYFAFLKKGNRASYLLALAAYALGLMAKPMLVTLPLLLLLLDIWPLRRLRVAAAPQLPPGPGAEPTALVGAPPTVQRLLLEKLPYLLLALASALVTLAAQGSGQAVATLNQIPFSYRLSNALWSTVRYLDKTLFPFDLAVYYPYALVPAWKGGLAALFLALLSFFAWRYRQRHGYLTLGWFWYLITLLPVIGVVQVGSQAMADRYSYLPHIGLFVAASWGGLELLGKLRLPDSAARLAAGSLLAFFAVATWLQLGYWQDNERLLKRTIAITRNNYFAHFALGGHYEGEGKLEQALEEYWKVLHINPGAKGIHLYLGKALAKQGRTEEAIAYLNEALRRNPRVSEAHFYLGVCQDKLGRLEQAAAAYRCALQSEPENPRCHTNLGAVLARQGRLDQAVACFSRALELDPRDAKAAQYLQLARTLEHGAGR